MAAIEPVGERPLMRRARGLSTLLLLALALAGCEGGAEDNAVEAREHNRVELGGVRYRVVLFRELNVLTAPDAALWSGAPPRKGIGLYTVVLRACGAGEDPAPATGEIRLENAFGERFAPRSDKIAQTYEYRPRMLRPGECLPREDSPAADTFGGAALVFAVPFEATAERPMILELGDPSGDATTRVQLDL